MYPYSVHIMEHLGEGSDKAKFEYLKEMQKLLCKLAYPRRGTNEETMSLQDFADEAAKLITANSTPHNYKPRD